MFTSRIRMIATTGLLCGALTVASIGSAFAAPVADNPPPATAAVTHTQSGQHQGHPGLVGLFFGSVSHLFGITPNTLLSQLEQGQTLAQIAGNYGKSATDVENAIMGALKIRLDKAVASGKISSDQETQILNKAPSRVDNLVNKNLSSQAKKLAQRGKQVRVAHHRATQGTTGQTATTSGQ